MMHVLDRPVWNALATVHAGFAQGSELAKRYDPTIVPFAAPADLTQASLDALASLPAPSEVMVIVESQPVETPPSLETVMDAVLVQMVAEKPFEPIEDPRIKPLGEADAEEMLELANLTKPGPFTLRARALGTFWGIRESGRLVAMAGQRMRQPGYAELSGLCTRPEFQGQGLGKTMMRFVAGEISARGDAVFLHAYRSNVGAIAMYEKMGFSLRREMHMRVTKRPN
ncbi:GNAT family N-acetyltransferase [Rhizobium sp. NTR19]|uniref:GNAT family N-acetyltransferase n=1 Tax=Neorhizobium turbinariae TaxID=2937795 RepID=A0ABT0IKL2_9HYPH|nr:GNAT family N-acetyltransferase [Neorhizobium turbinariae]MCK8778414.1 GNAT family N-acetyltransferase [Neorhizobium turbinariae]